MSAFAIIGPNIDRGYKAAVRGLSTGCNPWVLGTVASEAWMLGFKVGSLPRPIRWALWVWARVCP